MNKQGVYHISEVPYAYGKDRNTLGVRIRTSKNDMEKVELFFRDKYYHKLPFEKVEMKHVGSTELFDFYEGEISNRRSRFQYYFKLTSALGEESFYSERGFSKEINEWHSYIFPYIPQEDLYEEIPWLEEGVVYQIFPDRFRNGDCKNDPPYVGTWGKGKINYHSVYGGDIRGVIEKIDYLVELGVTILYMTPIFKSSSPHKYNTEDYFNIDPQFGTLEDFRELVEKCHENNIKVILDGVFNHSGDDFFAFKDVALHGKKSKYYDWYFVDNYPFKREEDYYTFAVGVKNMPKLNLSNRDTREYFLKVGEFWVEKMNIDGWRLDVCDEVSHSFWKEFRIRVKSVKSEAVIIGEIMHEATSFLRGDEMDSIMNYPFKNAITDFFAFSKISGEEFSSELLTSRMLYMNSIGRQMLNLIDSHDTKRFLTECKDSVEKMKLALIFQFTYIGVPYIYYGDEVGLNGGDDPENRKCMIWERELWNMELFSHYKKLIRMRRENPIFVYGEYREKNVSDNIIVFERVLKDERILVVLNNNDEVKVVKLNEEMVLKEVLTEKVERAVEITIGAFEGRVFKILS